jgi:hypothetical protein
MGSEQVGNLDPWIRRSPLLYGLELRVCRPEGANPNTAVDGTLDAEFQFSPRAIPQVANGRTNLVWSVAACPSNLPSEPTFAGLRIRYEWDELLTDAAFEPEPGARLVNLSADFFEPVGGNVYSTSLMSHTVALGRELVRPEGGLIGVRLYENGAMLRPSDQRPPLVEGLARGQYVLRGSEVLFSASDDTDPRTNGRIYTVETLVAPDDASSRTAPLRSDIDRSRLRP